MGQKDSSRDTHNMPTLARLREHYDEKYKASDFSEVTAVPLVVSPVNRLQMAVYHATKQAGGQYLEIGAGDGGTILALIEKYDGLVATDLSEVRVRQMQLLFQGNPRVQVLQNNVEVDGLPFADDTFETAAMVDVIEHVVDPIGVLKEIRRVLRTKGRLIVLTPNIAKWTRRLKLLAGYFPSTASLQEGLVDRDKKTLTDLHDEGHLHYFTFRSLTRLAIERAGFARVETAGYGKSSCLCRMWPEMFSDVCLILQK
jgi:ubiquinone/menaquinone biosynthesis C-methylase UbiE